MRLFFLKEFHSWIKLKTKASFPLWGISGLGSEAIKRIGGDLPEDIPPAEHIKQVEKRINKASPKLKLDDKEAKGLIG